MINSQWEWIFKVYHARCENRDKRRLNEVNEENVKVLTCSAVDIAVNKIEQSFQYALDFYY